jgi:hypothetical protein
MIKGEEHLLRGFIFSLQHSSRCGNFANHFTVESGHRSCRAFLRICSRYPNPDRMDGYGGDSRGDGTHRIEGNICLAHWSCIYKELSLQDERILDRVNAMVNVDNTLRWCLWSRMFLHVSDIRVVLLVKGGNVPNDLLRYIVITRCNVPPSLRTGELFGRRCGNIGDLRSSDMIRCSGITFYRITPTFFMHC